MSVTVGSLPASAEFGFARRPLGSGEFNPHEPLGFVVVTKHQPSSYLLAIEFSNAD